MTQVVEITRTRQEGRFFVVELLSATTGKWMVVGEHLTAEAAKADLKNWR